MVRPGRDHLAGTVEVDERFIGGERPGKRGRGAAGKTLIVIAAQALGTKIGRIRSAQVASVSGNHLGGIGGSSISSNDKSTDSESGAR